MAETGTELRMAIQAQAHTQRIQQEREHMMWVVEEYPAALQALVWVIEAAIESGDWKVDGACDPDGALDACACLIRQLYDNDAEIRAIRAERDAYMKAALEGSHLTPLNRYFIAAGEVIQNLGHSEASPEETNR